jgi:hypothetical protein
MDKLTTSWNRFVVSPTYNTATKLRYYSGKYPLRFAAVLFVLILFILAIIFGVKLKL